MTDFSRPFETPASSLSDEWNKLADIYVWARETHNEVYNTDVELADALRSVVRALNSNPGVSTVKAELQRRAALELERAEREAEEKALSVNP
jgi:hypothetical protein